MPGAPETPSTPESLAEALASAAARKRTITLGGSFSKRLMAGPVEPADITISTTGLRRVLQYEPRDLTISVEAGLPWRELVQLLARNRQMVPLDPPFADTATVGGVIAANCSGPRRRQYGTARDLVIGMKFATLEGKLVQSGGMVVKNVAGLDMGKLMIGSFGTLAAIAVVNFKLLPRPAVDRTFLLPFNSLDEAIAVRDAILKSVLQPAAIDLLNPLTAAQLSHKGHVLAVEFGGSPAVIERCRRDLPAYGSLIALDETDSGRFWQSVENFPVRFLDKFTDGAVVRVSGALTQMRDIIESIDAPAIARAGSGVCQAFFGRCDSASRWVRKATGRGWRAVIEFAPDARRSSLELWPKPGGDFEMIRKVKHLFDPDRLLNRGRLYRLI